MDVDVDAVDCGELAEALDQTAGDDQRLGAIAPVIGSAGLGHRSEASDGPITGAGGLSGCQLPVAAVADRYGAHVVANDWNSCELLAPQVLGDLVGIAELVGELDEQVTGVLRLVGLQVEVLELTDQLVHVLTVLVGDLLADLQGQRLGRLHVLGREREQRLAIGRDFGVAGACRNVGSARRSVGSARRSVGSRRRPPWRQALPWCHRTHRRRRHTRRRPG